MAFSGSGFGPGASSLRAQKIDHRLVVRLFAKAADGCVTDDDKMPSAVGLGIEVWDRRTASDRLTDAAVSLHIPDDEYEAARLLLVSGGGADERGYRAWLALRDAWQVAREVWLSLQARSLAG